ncbi:MAG TPA: S-methyl-5'-thioadenosine phosphorylase [Flavobacteriales bacterium]|nr:S-methyl-5'-thioadenosine phosphorylase [Flavobacteriales bacterium]
MSQTGIIGIIGGSGFYNMAGISDVREVEVETPFGKPSDPVRLGKLGGRDVAFIARHGRGHRYNPTNVPARANIFALKTLGVTHLISVSAVGSMKEEIEPLHMVVPNQLFDRTVHRPRTFFDEGPVVHVAFAEPYCHDLRESLTQAAESVGATVHRGGTYICIEGPQFSTQAESIIYRGWGISVIGMTALPEARLAREAEMCYATLAMTTDYDTWHPDHDSVTVDLVVSNLNKNVQRAKDTVAALVPAIASTRTCTCDQALASSIMTTADLIPDDVKKRLEPLIGKYI